jgi:nucleoside-diphosphate-sugar epimerase
MTTLIFSVTIKISTTIKSHAARERKSSPGKEERFFWLVCDKKQTDAAILMKILLTGAFGNLGSSALPELLRQGHQVRCFILPGKKYKDLARRFAGQIEIVAGDMRNPADLQAAVQDQEAIIHLAYILPPDTEEQPEVAQAVNVDGTRYLLEAASSLPTPPKFFFASSLDVFGPTQHLPPPRKVTDPVQASDAYSAQKIACEEMVKASGLPWTIFRFADIPPVTMRSPHPIMYRVPLETRFEMVHTYDAGLAIANAMQTEAVWGKIMLIGGGANCQILYRDYLKRSLEIMGIGMLPESAFSQEPYVTDWLDTEESQRLLSYQRATFEDIMRDLERIAGFTRVLATIARPAARWWLLRMSPFYRTTSGQSLPDKV